MSFLDKIRRKRNIYLMDENVKMSVGDIEKLSSCDIINSTDKFPKGTRDEILTEASKENDWIIVTKDIRMALRSLQDNVPVIYISDKFRSISFLSVSIYGRARFPEMFDYIEKRFGYKAKQGLST